MSLALVGEHGSTAVFTPCTDMIVRLCLGLVVFLEVRLVRSQLRLYFNFHILGRLSSWTMSLGPN